MPFRPLVALLVQVVDGAQDVDHVVVQFWEFVVLLPLLPDLELGREFVIQLSLVLVLEGVAELVHLHILFAGLMLADFAAVLLDALAAESEAAGSFLILQDIASSLLFGQLAHAAGGNVHYPEGYRLLN